MPFGGVKKSGLGARGYSLLACGDDRTQGCLLVPAGSLTRVRNEEVNPAMSSLGPPRSGKLPSRGEKEEEIPASKVLAVCVFGARGCPAFDLAVCRPHMAGCRVSCKIRSGEHRVHRASAFPGNRRRVALGLHQCDFHRPQKGGPGCGRPEFFQPQRFRHSRNPNRGPGGDTGEARPWCIDDHPAVGEKPVAVSVAVAGS